MKESLLGYKVNYESVHNCVNAIENKLTQSKQSSASKNVCVWLACLNPHSYVLACDDEAFSNALHGADWLVPDGVGILMASRVLGDRRAWRDRRAGPERPVLSNRRASNDRRNMEGQIKERVTGSDVFFGLHERLNAVGGFSVFFLGSTQETLANIRLKMATDYPNIQVAGTYSPPFKPEYSPTELDDMINAINISNADVLWVGMTAPKQEKWIFQNKDRLNVHFVAAIGAVFDFYTGKVQRSHPLFQRFGLEWLPRLLQEPRRLWRRMGISAPIFLYHTLFRKLEDK
ncbi:WecB/TagA/CpsF family glycosyltransferase [Crenothrix sp.]|uniref:WecB/TagA/CpsF family glycosyltransferase n=1 Tax=Crenothrix sp. TaxID=3100433 RepID=UPI00374D97E8